MAINGITTSNDPYGNLPLMGNWRYRPYDFTTFTIKAGETRDGLIDLRRRGWVVWGFVTHNNPNMNCVIELETGTENYRNSFSTNDLYNIGAVQPSNAWYVSRYDTVNNIYNVTFTPSAWYPFYRRFKMSLDCTSSTTDTTVARVGVLCIEFQGKGDT